MVIRARRLAEPHKGLFGLGHCLAGRKIPDAHRTFITEARVQVGGIVRLEPPEAQPPSDERRECVGCFRQVVTKHLTASRVRLDIGALQRRRSLRSPISSATVGALARRAYSSPRSSGAVMLFHSSLRRCSAQIVRSMSSSG